MTRKHVNLKTKLAAAIGALFLTYDERKELSEDQVLSLVHFDHDPIPHAEGGTGDHFNLVPLLIGGHRVKTATVDVPGIAKRKRVSEAEQQFRARMLAKSDPEEGLASAIRAIEGASRFPQGRKLQSRNTFQKRKDT